jgi:hypothetical protein
VYKSGSFKKYTTLLRVVNGGPYDGQPLDINGQLISISGLTQASKPNLESDPDYIEPIEDYTSCPLPTIDKEFTINITTLEDVNVDILIKDLFNNEDVFTDIITNVSTGFTVTYINNIGSANIIFTNNSLVDLNYLIEDDDLISISGILESGGAITTVNIPKTNLTLSIST